MAIISSGQRAFQPYARLISILGDQLISDKWVGVIELVKNCYDADAENVNVIFLDFDKDSKNPNTIIIEDDGIGMDIDIILDVWMKPATPNKLNKKKSTEKRFTSKRRVMQGDKGVGRFAIYKLGDYVEVYTKTKKTDEVKLTLDFHSYADDSFEESDHKDKFLDEIFNEYEVNDVPTQIIGEKKQGTKIIIKDLRNLWKEEDMDKLLKAFYRMMPPSLPGIKSANDFDVNIYWNKIEKKPTYLSFGEIIELAPYYFEGFIDLDGNLDFSYKYNKKTVTKSFNLFDDSFEIANYDLWNIKLFRDIFLSKIDQNSRRTTGNLEIAVRPKVGRFMFFFYAFDWANPIEGLKENEKKFIQENSVFLYRDNVRVYPYGEKGIDWLHLSKGRAEDRATNYFSYNDLIGFVFISQSENPNLRDAADREGLMNIDGAVDEFTALIQASLKVMKNEVDIDKAKSDLIKQKAITSFNKNFEDSFVSLQKQLLRFDDKNLIDSSKKFFNDTNILVQKVREDLKITQELAGTGMAVEKATHDTMSLLKRLKSNTEDITSRVDQDLISVKEFKEFLLELQENLEFLYQELQVLQPLFRVARKVTRNVSVKDVAERVLKYFRKEIVNRVDVSLTQDQDVIVKTNTGLILQVLLNLMDNAIYWLDQIPDVDRKISIKLDKNDNSIIFADSGIGIDPEIKEIIFTEFYSKKSDGRGLGLYIVKELLERIDAEIEVITEPSLKILSGANFKITFKNEIVLDQE